MVHAGVGEYHMNAIFTTIGLPSATFKTYKKSERTVGPMIEKVAEVSCQNACKEEEMMEKNNQVTFEEALAMLESFDGNNTNSLYFCLFVCAMVREVPGSNPGVGSYQIL